MRIDFAYIEALQANARRERAEAVYELLILPVIRFFSRPAPAPKVAPLRSRLA